MPFINGKRVTSAEWQAMIMERRRAAEVAEMKARVAEFEGDEDEGEAPAKKRRRRTTTKKAEAEEAIAEVTGVDVEITDDEEITNESE